VLDLKLFVCFVLVIGMRKQVEAKKRIVSLLVEDQPGVIERLSGLFLRRGFSIETIIAGRTATPGISTIVISLFADKKTLEQLEKQVYKVIEVIKVIDLTENSVVREHCLIKVNSTPQTRQDILNFAKLSNAKVLEANHKSILIEVVDEPEAIDKFVESMKTFGVKEVSRTGVNAMGRA
jgi:acetolactate synthase-1/3 small subunit